MFYISEIKKLYEAVKADNSIEESDKQKSYRANKSTGLYVSSVLTR